MSMLGFALGAAAGAGAAWFLDPNDGTRRRHVVGDKAMKYARRGKATAVRRTDYAVGVVKGAAVSAVPGTSRPDAGRRLNDPALARKVETEVFRDPEIPKGEVSVNAEEGVVYLRGEIERPEMIERLGQRAAAVEGVRSVRNLLHVPGTPAPTA